MKKAVVDPHVEKELLQSPDPPNVILALLVQNLVPSMPSPPIENIIDVDQRGFASLAAPGEYVVGKLSHDAFHQGEVLNIVVGGEEEISRA